jgi:uncharacterized protein
MSGLFTIPVSGLKEGQHTFHFEINDKFFDLFEESEIKEGNLDAILTVEKRLSHLDVVARISGKVRICCDRCLEMLDYPVECENRLIVRFGNEPDDEDPEIITIPRDECELDLSQYLYEYIHLAMPIQRFHPDDSNGNSTCDPAMILKLREHLVGEETKNDPRWSELKKLINDN